jgi:hypothetical protein
MRSGLRPTLVAAVAAAALLAGSPAQAAPAAPARPATALPSYSTWIADVTAVAGDAGEYLQDRLPDRSIKAAVVLDIDNTSLQTTYKPGLTSPATPPILALAQQAEADGAAIFFVSSRPMLLKWQTELNLAIEDYPVEDVYLRPWFNTEPDDELKTGVRETIESLGYRIVANIGNSESDLSGGHADRTFKLPDYDGQLI